MVAARPGGDPGGAVGGRMVVGVDVGGTKIAAALVGPGHRLLTSRRMSTPPESDALLVAIENIASELARDSPEPIAAVGVGVPCVVDRAGRVLWGNHVDLDGVNVRDELRARLGCPVVVLNDGEMAALAEATLGAARDHDSSVTLTLGTGIGGGVVIRGGLLLGGRGGGPEMGHVVVEADGPPCPGRCPSRGCVEAMASGTAVAREAAAAAAADPDGPLARAGRHGPLTADVVAELALAGDARCEEILARAGRYLGVALAGLANVLSPEVFVIGGGMSAVGELILAPARDEYRRRAIPPAAGASVVRAALGAEAGVLGAALAAREAPA